MLGTDAATRLRRQSLSDFVTLSALWGSSFLFMRLAADELGALPTAGLRVGLYVGGNAGAPGEGMVMTQGTVITDRDTLRKHPPDILLTTKT